MALRVGAEWVAGERSGVRVSAYPDGLLVTGWYDSIVGIEGGFLTWEEIEAMRKAAKRRKPFRREAPNAQSD